MAMNYFNFARFHNKFLLTSDTGGYVFLDKDELLSLVSKKELAQELIQKLESAGIVFDSPRQVSDSSLVESIRSAKRAVLSGTSLHIFVVTTACNMRCIYCQANNGIHQPDAMMDMETAKRSVEIALSSPEKFLTFEFQGGEPLVNFPVIKAIVEYAEENKGSHQIRYSLVSNLLLLEDEMIEFFKQYQFGISTSIDGPEDLHNKNRMISGGTGSFAGTVRGVKRLQASGLKVGAIQTTTRYSLARAKEIVQTYYDLGFDAIFIRPLTPLGKAARFWDEIGYSTDEFLAFFQESSEAAEQLNSQERPFSEMMSDLFRQRILNHDVNYMELRSPCGAGIGQLAYFTDGNVFTCDEGRMVYEMGDDSFKLGNVFEQTYEEIISSPACQTTCKASMLETIPTCCDCVYQPYCGVCPVVNLSLEKDLLEKSPNGYRCRINKGILDHLFEKLYQAQNHSSAIDKQ